MEKDDRELIPEEPPPDEKAILRKVHRIVDKGNHAEIRKKKDGTLAVYEVKMSIVET